MAVPPWACNHLSAVAAAAEGVPVAQMRRHEPGVWGEDYTTVVTMFGHTLTGNLSRGKAEQEELKAEDGSTLLEGVRGEVCLRVWYDLLQVEHGAMVGDK